MVSSGIKHLGLMIRWRIEPLAVQPPCRGPAGRYGVRLLCKARVMVGRVLGELKKYSVVKIRMSNILIRRSCT